jgi:Cof subfamily protein (haloacid dehalogenase superfamily)
MADIDVVVTDLDGTLWSGREEVHPTTVAAWRALEERGITVMVATGRRVRSTREPLARLGLTPPAVVLNGALVVDLATDERLHRRQYDADTAATVLAAFRAAGVEPCVYVDDPALDVYVGERPATHPTHLASLRTTVAPSDLDDVVASVPILMFGLMGHDDPAPLGEIVASLAGMAELHLAPDGQFGGHSFTVTPLGLSKWVGVEIVCERRGLDASRVLAIGDGTNDIELLGGAAIAVVPRDGCEPARKLADHLVSPARDGGWAEILDLV